MHLGTLPVAIEDIIHAAGQFGLSWLQVRTCGVEDAGSVRHRLRVMIAGSDRIEELRSRVDRLCSLLDQSGLQSRVEERCRRFIEDWRHSWAFRPVRQ